MRPRQTAPYRRVWVVDGIRTPFIHPGGAFATVTAADLGALAVREALLAGGARPEQVEQVVVGSAFSRGERTNLAREVAIRAGLPGEVVAHTVCDACLSFHRAFADAALQIETGRTDVAVVVGVESVSERPLSLGRPLARALADAGKAKTFKDRIDAFREVRPRDLVPAGPGWADLISGETLGESAERLAKDLGITRKEQDAFAHTSHVRAVTAMEEGLIASHVAGVPVHDDNDAVVVSADDLVRETSPDRLARLRPSFDTVRGSVTPGNSAPLADGAAALLLASDAFARAQGWSAKGALRALSFRAVDPGRQPLMAPVPAVADVLDILRVSIEDLGVWEMHEAFAAGVLANLRGLSDPETCARYGIKPRREVDPGQVNQWGGSIAFGHPLGASGGRQILSLLDQLRHVPEPVGLLSSSAAGGQGAALAFEPC